MRMKRLLALLALPALLALLAYGGLWVRDYGYYCGFHDGFKEGHECAELDQTGTNPYCGYQYPMPNALTDRINRVLNTAPRP